MKLKVSIRLCFSVQSLTAAVLLQAMKEDPPLDAKCRDKFLVQTTAITADKEFNNVQTLVFSAYPSISRFRELIVICSGHMSSKRTSRPSTRRRSVFSSSLRMHRHLLRPRTVSVGKARQPEPLLHLTPLRLTKLRQSVRFPACPLVLLNLALHATSRTRLLRQVWQRQSHEARKRHKSRWQT